MVTVQHLAMHMSDGIVNAQTSVLFGAIALITLGVCGWKSRTELDERTVPLAGLVAAFIFAVQMVNFPILPGVSGHLLGGALAAILVGPYTGALCIAIVLVVQSLLFADGGVTALGTNIVNMAIIGVGAGYGLAVAMYAVARRRADGPPVRIIGLIAFFAGLIGTVCAAMGFVLEYAIGGAAPASMGTVAGYMFITHVLIGVGEGVITAVTVMAVARARPDLVYLLRGQRAEVPV
ncbi:cobalamin biosynthesis protein CbiM [Mycolicibacterium cyprinidarum]|uniref:Cobalamin biosynthesis protein CbiM n=1 Tax=Mycolicibacterium cyprinidarum TaxID=2860311 RepID=A0ABQ4V9X5_9MYCO|nr:cobalamin biosynthesis protein CbiM [Mycolicibacterium sp. NGTWSNA01]GJF13728.1 cobalamin biosynthesis protein CbiM [Mycolicibacterium sp. NGTWS0302]